MKLLGLWELIIPLNTWFYLIPEVGRFMLTLEEDALPTHHPYSGLGSAAGSLLPSKPSTPCSAVLALALLQQLHPPLDTQRWPDPFRHVLPSLLGSMWQIVFP